MGSTTFEDFGKWFWNDDFWLPPNVTWDQFQTTENSKVRYASFNDLFWPIPMAFGIIFLRFVVENMVFRPLGRSLGLKENRKRHPGSNDILEKAFQLIQSSAKSIQQEEILRLSKQLQMTERRIERWLRQRALIGKPSQLDKFAETGWRWLYYTSIFAFGMKCLWSKAWFWNITDCWYGYPYHKVDSDVWWWYMVELAFYWGLLGTQFVDVKRKDFWMMCIHHLATIFLMAFSWTCNLFKVGTLVLIIHDIADIFLESAKLCKYGGAKKVSEILFGSFALSWFITRLGIFPTWIIYSVTVEAPQVVQYFPAYFIFNGLLSLLLLLNIMWAYFICKAVYAAVLNADSIANDIRSDTSDMETSSYVETDDSHSSSKSKKKMN